MKFTRSAGILLHISSLPGLGGIGSLGTSSFAFADFLYRSGQNYWQILPLNPVGYGNSPYFSSSSFAGNPLLIDTEFLFKEDLITYEQLHSYKDKNPHAVNYPKVAQYKNRLLIKAYYTFIKKGLLYSKSFINFCTENSYWLDNYAQYKVLKQKDINKKEKINYEKFVQYIFFKQWFKLKKYINSKGIKIIGDIPFYVPCESADVYFNSDLFHLDNNKNPSLVSGVPPDYFSKTGQLWNMPVYNWEEHKKQDYTWWFNRIIHALKIVDIIRLDHFRGFSEFWAVDSKEKTAVNGKWMKGPGDHFFKSLYNKLSGKMPIIAEDLGSINFETENLRDKFNLYGMRVLQFAFNDLSNNLHLPHNHIPKTIVYTGTHDNNTTLGWYLDIDNLKKKRIQRYLQTNGSSICWDLIDCAYASAADIAIIPLQDIFCLGKNARMNTPGTIEGNWQWRFTSNMLTGEIEYKLNDLCQIYYR